MPDVYRDGTYLSMITEGLSMNTTDKDKIGADNSTHKVFSFLPHSE